VSDSLRRDVAEAYPKATVPTTSIVILPAHMNAVHVKNMLTALLQSNQEPVMTRASSIVCLMMAGTKTQKKMYLYSQTSENIPTLVDGQMGLRLSLSW